MPIAMPNAHERQAGLTSNRHRKMASSAHAYVRGNTAKFYEWLEASPAARRVFGIQAVVLAGSGGADLVVLAATNSGYEMGMMDLGAADWAYDTASAAGGGGRARSPRRNGCFNRSAPAAERWRCWAWPGTAAATPSVPTGCRC